MANPFHRLPLLGLILLWAVPASGLEPDQIILLVNSNVPAGRSLAEFYRAARLIPDDRIVALKLPLADDISFGAYERDVVPPLRDYLRANALQQKVTCIVAFYGVPLRIGPRLLTPEDRQEIASLRTDHGQLLTRLRQSVADMEADARRADPSFQPLEDNDLEGLSLRAQAAVGRLARQAADTDDPSQRASRLAVLLSAVMKLNGPAGVLRIFGTPDATLNQTAEGQALLKDLAARLQTIGDHIGLLQQKRNDPDARARMRTLVADGFGIIDHVRVIQAHLDYLNAAHSTAAFDSELALLWWDCYPRAQWQPNPLHYQVQPNSPLHSRPTLMVTRLDAPQSGQVRDIILTGLKAERTGLKGKVVLDSQGIKSDAAKSGSYGWYDQSIRDLAELIRTSTKLQLLHDDSPLVLPPGAATDVALYCGWYSRRNYIPSCRFSPGAVAFHVSSFELVSLRADDEHGWAHGLINDGVAATLGAVAEPYLAAFPRADDFFALLLTGKLTLAEVYWKTTPTTSWMLAIIGDPLYNPYKNHPALRVDDLPQRLRPVFDAPPARQTPQ